MNEQDKSFLTFLRQVYGSVEGQGVLLSLLVWVPGLYLAWLYSPTDFVRSGTFNAWWIIIIIFALWIHALFYLLWRDSD